MATQKKRIIDTEALLKDLENVEGLSDRVRIAGYGLAAPLLRMRESQMQREIKRVAARKGKDHPEVAARKASLQRTEERRVQFDEELSRARLDQPRLTGEDSAGIYGRVAEAGKPLANMTVITYAVNERVDFTCTKENGAFALEAPAESDVIISVRTVDGAEVYRDPLPTILQPGEHRFREIDLKRSPEDPCAEPEDEGPTDDKFAMVNLVGQTEAAARGIIVTQGLILGKRSERPVDEGVGRVLEQKPEAGTVVRRGDVVSMVVASSNLVLVPNLTGLKPEEARKLLKENELKLGQVSTVSVRDDQAGLVVHQDPAPNSRLLRGGPVSIEVGDANELTVPNLIGRTAKEGKALLEKTGLQLGEVEITPISTDKAGLILEQNPAAGSRLAPGEAVSITVGRRDEVSVPNISGLPEENGVKILHEAGLTVGEVGSTPVTGEKVGIIINQNPSAGSQILRGSAVSIEVGRLDEVTVPDVIGRTEDEAVQIIKKTGLKLGTVSTTPVSTNQVGRVVGQDPGTGGRVPRGTPISITVGILEQVVVPNVGGKKLVEANKMLQKVSLKAGKIAQVPTTANKVGRVLSQNPKSGRKVAPGTSVALGLGVRRGLGFNAVTDRAEKTVRAKGVGVDEDQGFLASRLKSAGITTTPKLDAFLKKNPQEIRDKLEFRNLNITKKAISALKATLKSG